MCDPTGGIATAALMAASAGTSIYGASKTAQAQKDAANAIQQQNTATSQAQNLGFTQRAAATQAQTQAQQQAFQQTMGNEQQIAGAATAGQGSAIQQQQDVLSGVNQLEQGYAGQGAQNATDLLNTTSGANLGQAQTDYQAQAANLLNTSGVPALAGTDNTGGTGDDASVNAALTRRAAEAATNIRQWGADASKVGSYSAPLALTQNAITNSQTGIMPAAAASKLLTGSLPTLEQPSQVAWSNAQQLGQAGMAAAQQSGQSAQNIANLQYQNSTDLANLQQADTTQTAQNVAEQAKANAAYQAAMGGVISNIGNMGMQAAGFYGVNPKNFGNILSPSAAGGDTAFGASPSTSGMIIPPNFGMAGIQYQ